MRSLQAARKASSLGADLKKGFLLGGSSAGGNIAAVLSHMARDLKASPPLTAIWLNYPLTVGFEAVPEAFKKDYHALEQNADAKGLLNKKGLMAAYCKSKIQFALRQPAGVTEPFLTVFNSLLQTRPVITTIQSAALGVGSSRSSKDAIACVRARPGARRLVALCSGVG